MSKQPTSLSVMGPQLPASRWRRRGRLWECPACGKTYPRAGQVHSCRRLTLDHHFKSAPALRRLFNAYLKLIRAAGGPIRLSIARTRIGILREITFSAVYPRKGSLRITFLLLRRLESPRILAVEHLPPYWNHTITVGGLADLDDDLRAWLAESYDAGKGLRPIVPPARSGAAASRAPRP